MGGEIQLHERLPNSCHRENAHHLAERLLGAVQIVGPDLLVDYFEDEAGSKNVICTRKGRSVKTLKEWDLLCRLTVSPWSTLAGKESPCSCKWRIIFCVLDKAFMVNECDKSEIVWIR